MRAKDTNSLQLEVLDVNDAGNLFVVDRRPSSRRHASLVDDGESVWMYLTEPDSLMSVADV